MDQAAQGALVIWHDVSPAAESLVTEWYNREHQLERVRIPGFLSARRYVAPRGAPWLFNLYRVADPSVLVSTPYLECVDHPSEMSRRAIPHCLRMIRTVCAYLFQTGMGEGGVAGTWRLSAPPHQEAELIAWLREQALPAAANESGIVSASLLKGDAELSSRTSSERGLRPDQQAPADLVMVITGSDEESVSRMAERTLSESALRAHGADGRIAFGIYRLAYAVEAVSRASG